MGFDAGRELGFRGVALTCAVLACAGLRPSQAASAALPLGLQAGLKCFV